MAYGLPGYPRARADGGLDGTSGSNYPPGIRMPGWWQKYLSLTRGQFPDWWANRRSVPEGMDRGWMQAIARWEKELGNINQPTGGRGSFGDGSSFGGGGSMGYNPPKQLSPPSDSGGFGGYKWMPEMFSQIYGKLGTEQTAHRDWIKELMGLTRSTMADTTAGLARGLGSHMSRTNVPIPAGADIMARRYLSPMTQSMESQLAQLQAMLNQPQSRLGMATGLTQQMAPLFRGRGLPDLSQLWGGGK